MNLSPAEQTTLDACRRKVAAAPNDPNTLRLLAMIEAQVGRFDAAKEALSKATSIAPDNAEIAMAEAYVLAQAKELPAAIEALRRVVRLAPKDPEAYRHIGDLSMTLGRAADATQAYKTALTLNPRYTEVYNNLGNLMKGINKLAEAQACYLQGIKVDPTMPELYNNLGLVVQQVNPDPKAAEACFQKALELRKDYPDALNNLGNALRERGRTDDARVCFSRALELAPQSPEAHNNIGLLRLHVDCDFKGARAAFEAALSFRPDYPEAINNLGVVLRLLGDQEEGLALFRRALHLRPNYTAALNNLGNALKDFGFFDDAIAAYRQGLALQPNDVETKNNLAMALLAAGQYDEGWPLYEARWETKHLAAATRRLPQPRWAGETGADKTLLITAEQGFGDTLQFCRYAAMAKAKGVGHVVLEVQGALVRLLQNASIASDGVYAQGNEPPPIDWHIPMLSLPALFKTQSDALPWPGPYLRPTEDDKAAWAARLPPLPARTKRVGLVWAGSSRRHTPDLIATDRRRSVAAKTLQPLIDIPGLQFYTLQKEGAPAPFPLIDLMAQSRDFADTAALIAHLDLVISVDTAVAHLAAGMGCPVWLLNRRDSCWRWDRASEKTGWYPSMRLFHQTRWNDWSDVIERVRDALKVWAQDDI
jgi:Flp pilus assembly protein TadD